MQFRTPDPNLLYLITVFAIEPAYETRRLVGSLGRVDVDGDLDWHVEVIQAKRDPDRYSSGAAIAIVYMRIAENEAPNVAGEEDVQAAFARLEGLIAPKEWRSQRPLRMNLISASTFRGTGKALGGAVYANTIYEAGAGILGRDGVDLDQIEHHPELRRAIRFYTRGIAAADERFLPDACINYARSLECLVGSTSHKPQLISECQRLGLDHLSVLEFLEKTRGRYAIGHALDHIDKGQRKLKELPTQEVEGKARALAKQAIASYIELMPGDTDGGQDGFRYFGLPPVSTKLPLPLEVLWAESGPWEYAAPGMAPDLVPMADLARRHGIRSSHLRSLIKRYLLRDFKRRGRVFLPSHMYDFYIRLRDETGLAYQGGRFVPLSTAAEACGLSLGELRELIREKRVKGYLRHRVRRASVDANSLRYEMWRRLRASVIAELGLPNRLRATPARCSSHRGC